MLVAGTSLEVAPAGELPQLAQAHGARLILINRGPTRLDAIADVVIRGDVAEVLPLLAAPWVLSPPAQPPPVDVDPPRPAAYNESRA
jgi:NAD-dependent deacetylase